jgi:hypothetical protein
MIENNLKVTKDNIKEMKEYLRDRLYHNPMYYISLEGSNGYDFVNQGLIKDIKKIENDIS